MQHSIGYFSLLAGSIGLGGCAAYASFFVPETSGVPPHVISMERMEILGAPNGFEDLASYDASTLLEQGQGQFQIGAYDQAVKAYARLITEFPNSSFAPLAHYNAGLAYEQLEAWVEAVGHYQAIIRDYQFRDLHKDSYFRIATAQAKVKNWKAVIDAFTQLRTAFHGVLLPMEEIESRVGLGVGQFMLGDVSEAEHTFLAALRYYDKQTEKEDLPVEYFIAQARFYLGESEASLFEAVVLVTPEELAAAVPISTSSMAVDNSTTPPDNTLWTTRVAARLETKCEHLLRAQNQFIRAVRVGHQGWATAAGYRVGSMYERLFDELLAVPVPPELAPDVVEIYQEELRERIAVLVRKATQVYRMNQAMANRVGVHNEWVERTEKALKRMSAAYLNE